MLVMCCDMRACCWISLETMRIGNKASRHIKTVRTILNQKPERVLKIFCQQLFNYFRSQMKSLLIGFWSQMKNLLIGQALQDIQILFVCKALVYKLNQKNRRKFDFMYHLTMDKMKSKCEARNFGNAHKQKKQILPVAWGTGLHPFLFAIGLCYGHHELCTASPRFAFDFLTITAH